jgi:phosphoribosyl-ATP pyrophosphohydrolase/phosphoribosyl-AMP cyclohydrolase
MTASLELDRLDFEKGGGLVTVVTQDHRTGAVLMVAHADREALERTLATGEMHYRSRSRGLWHKGATTGHTQRVVALLPDCDGDTVLARVEPAGPACHTGSPTCFGPIERTSEVLSRVDAVIAARAEAANGGQVSSSYTIKLLRDRNLRLKKLGEEAAELVAACAEGEPQRVAEEGADLVYHLMVAIRAAGGSLDAVRRVLERRESAPG